MQPKTLKEFLASSELKYAVITKESWGQDEVAQGIASNPRTFMYEGVELVLLSVSKYELQKLYDYVQGNVEYELTLGTGRVTLLLRSELGFIPVGIDDSE